MKKFTISLIGIIIVVVAAGIYLLSSENNQSNNSSSSVTSARATSSSQIPISTSDKKTLILYYSNSGTTEQAAQTIQQKTGGTIVKMKFNVTYPSDFNALATLAKKQIDKNIQPQITNLPNLIQYQTIYLGFPVWYHRPPMFINSFFKQANLKNKTVIPFATSASSPMSEVTPYLKQMARNTGVTLKTGFIATDEDAIAVGISVNKK